MFKFGAWFHSHDDLPLPAQLRAARAIGIESARSYSIGYAEAIVPTLRELGMSLYAGIHVDSGDLLRDWRSQVKPDELERYRRLGIPLEAICVGNELREFGDDPEKKRFTARVAFGLANAIAAYRQLLDEAGDKTPLTCALEGIVMDRDGAFYEHVRPLLDACDIISLNLYPMGAGAWHGPEQFEESRAFLRDARVRNDRLLRFEIQLRGVLAAAVDAGKPVILSETGFHSAVGREKDDAGRVAAISDGGRFGEVLEEMLRLICRADADYGRPIRAIYFYEWRDNPYHAKITNVERSPIHCAFGLCDCQGKPKFAIGEMLGRVCSRKAM